MKNISFLLSSTYLTRKCPMRCSYCRIRNSSITKELTPKEWMDAYSIIQDLPFHLILGNEPLMLGEGLVKLVKFFNQQHFSYGIYTTFPENLFNKYKSSLLRAGIKNLSCGIDVLPTNNNTNKNNNIVTKSTRGLKGLEWAKRVGIPELHATVTISKLNVADYPAIVDKLTDLGVWTEVNVIHYAKDKEYDFFPPAQEMKELVLSEKDISTLRKTTKTLKERVVEGKVKLHNVPEYFDDFLKYGLSLDWHCKHPLILAIDSDGSLRVCSYRKGSNLSKHSIFEFAESEFYDEYFADWKEDSKRCPGCFWSCWYHAEYYYNKNFNFGKKYYQNHTSEYWKEK